MPRAQCKSTEATHTSQIEGQQKLRFDMRVQMHIRCTLRVRTDLVDIVSASSVPGTWTATNSTGSGLTDLVYMANTPFNYGPSPTLFNVTVVEKNLPCNALAFKNNLASMRCTFDSYVDLNTTSPVGSFAPNNSHFIVTTTTPAGGSSSTDSLPTLSDFADMSYTLTALDPVNAPNNNQTFAPGEQDASEAAFWGRRTDPQTMCICAAPVMQALRSSLRGAAPGPVTCLGWRGTSLLQLAQSSTQQ